MNTGVLYAFYTRGCSQGGKAQVSRGAELKEKSISEGRTETRKYY
jgi:hypothetical protein